MSNTTLRVGCCYTCGGALGNPAVYIDGLVFHPWCVPGTPTMSSADRDTAQHWLRAEREITKQLRESIAALDKEIAMALETHKRLAALQAENERLRRLLKPTVSDGSQTTALAGRKT